MPTDPDQSQTSSSAEADLERSQLAQLRAHEASNTGEALRRKIGRQVDAWRHNRVRYPGWLIAPTANRRTLWAFTEEWSNSIVREASNAEAVERLRWLRELTWRVDLCLLPLSPEHAESIASALAVVEPFRPDPIGGVQLPSETLGVSSNPVARASVLRPTSDNLASYDWTGLVEDWFALACSLLRYHREMAEDVAFEALAKRLEMLPLCDPERLSFITHQRCLRAVERMEYDIALRLLTEWRDQGPDPFWMIRKAGLMAELGDGEGEVLSKRGLDAVRDLLSKSAARGDDLYALSREGWAMYAVRAVTRLPGTRGLDFRSRLEALAALRCDPAAIIEPLETTLETPTTEASIVRKSRFGALPFSLQAYQARRLLEESGYPLRFGHIFAGAQLLRSAVSWIGVASDRDGLLPLFRTGDTKFVQQYLSPDRVGRLVQDDAERTAGLALAALAAASPRLSRAVPPSLSSGDDRDALLAEATDDRAKLALKALEALAPRLEDETLDAVCMQIVEIRSQWSNGSWQVWEALGRTLSEVLREMSPDQSGRHLQAVAGLPLAGLDISFGPVIQWQEDPVIGLWEAKPMRGREDGSWRALVERLLRALSRTNKTKARAQAMLRLIVLYRSGALLPDERLRLAEQVWSQPAEDLSKNSLIDSVAVDGARAAPIIDFPLPVRFLRELPELHQDSAIAAIKNAVLGRPLPCFAGPADGRAPTWRFGPSYAADPLYDVLVATKKPWRTDEGDRTVDWTADDALALLDRIETWWNAEGPALWKAIHEDRGPFYSIMPRWRFTSIVDVVSLVVLPALGVGRIHLVRASDLIRRMRDEGVRVEFALPVLVAADPSTRIEVGRALRLSLASAESEKASAALPAIFAWLHASDLGVLEHPTDDLLQEVFSIVRSRREPALAVALQLAAAVLRNEARGVDPAFLEDVSIGLQHLAEETRYGLNKFVGAVTGDASMRMHAADLLAAYAPHVATDDETLRLWIAELDNEPMRSVRRLLATVRDKVASRAPGSSPRGAMGRPDNSTATSSDAHREGVQGDDLPPAS